MTRNILPSIAAVALLASPLFAQNTQVRFRGVISSFDGTTLVVQSPEGKTTSVAVPKPRKRSFSSTVLKIWVMP